MTPAEREALALQLMQAAAAVGGAVVAVSGASRQDAGPESPFRQETEAYERISLEGDALAVAFRTLAMRLDRAAMVRYLEQGTTVEGTGTALLAAATLVLQSIISTSSGPAAPIFDAEDYAVESRRGEWHAVDGKAIAALRAAVGKAMEGKRA